MYSSGCQKGLLEQTENKVLLEKNRKRDRQLNTFKNFQISNNDAWKVTRNKEKFDTIKSNNECMESNTESNKKCMKNNTESNNICEAQYII